MYFVLLQFWKIKSSTICLQVVHKFVVNFKPQSLYTKQIKFLCISYLLLWQEGPVIPLNNGNNYMAMSLDTILILEY